MIIKDLNSIQQEELRLKNQFYRKTDELLAHILVNIPSDTMISTENKELKVIYGPHDMRTLLLGKRPLSTFKNYEWVVDNMPSLLLAVEELEKKQVEEMKLAIEKTKIALEKVDKLQANLKATHD